MNVLGIYALSFLLCGSAWARSDNLGQRTIQVAGPDAEAKLNASAANLKHIFDLYRPQLDDYSVIVSPYTVSGTETNPQISVTIQTCIHSVCKTVDMEGDITMKEVTGDCDRNLLLNIDLQNSGGTLSEDYDSLQTEICFHKGADGAGTLDVTGSAHRAETYSGGIVAGLIRGMLQDQIDPLVDALQQTL